MRIIFISPEVTPFAKTGGLADVSGILPGTLNNLGHHCSIIMPLYQMVRRNGFNLQQLKSGLKVKLGDIDYQFNLFFTNYEDIEIYFIDNPHFYDRPYLYGPPQADYPDNALRFAFFCRASLAVANQIGPADVIHCNDWQTGLVPLYKRLYPKEYGESPVLFTVHNLAYQGLFPAEVMPELDIPSELFKSEEVEFYGRLSFIKAGLQYSDAINTVSKGYARQIMTEEFGCGLDSLLRLKQSSLYGIINGSNYQEWDPNIDPYIKVNYDASTLHRKMECKIDLLEHIGLPVDIRKPVLGIVSRLVEQKGIDLVAECLDKILKMGVYFVVLGVGDERYTKFFSEASRRYSDSVSVNISFDNELAHKIEAGSDIFLMPSRYEPCGLNQMYSLKYGTVPVVRATGGLDETVQEFDPVKRTGTGFKFQASSATDFFQAVKRAVELFKTDKMAWSDLQLNGLKCDFSWYSSAIEYIELYKKIIEKQNSYA